MIDRTRLSDRALIDAQLKNALSNGQTSIRFQDVEISIEGVFTDLGFDACGPYQPRDRIQGVALLK
jgi:hypothetical protein